MKQYLDSLRLTMEQGYDLPDRTGIGRRTYPGMMMRFDVSNGKFPAVTTKKLAFKSVVAELLGFLRAKRSAKDFRDLGTKIWDQNANENAAWLANPYRKGEDDLGPIYGVQWRQWPAYKEFFFHYEDLEVPKEIVDRGCVHAIAVSRDVTLDDWNSHIAKVTADRKAGVVISSEVIRVWRCNTVDYTPEGVCGVHVVTYRSVDQLKNCIELIMSGPTDRRILFHAWNPAVLDEVALPACHLLYQFFPNPVTRELSLSLYVRSNDSGLGTPFNIASAALLLNIVAKLTGYIPKEYIHIAGDYHIYHNHFDMVNELLTREPFPEPKLSISDKIGPAADAEDAIRQLARLKPEDFALVDYQHHEHIAAPMAV